MAKAPGKPEALQEAARAWGHFTLMDNIEAGNAKIMVKADGCMYTDINGKELIDGLAALFVVNIGHGRKEIRDAVYAQMEQMSFFSMFFNGSNLPVIKLSKKLREVVPDGIENFYFVVSGSEAVESCLKIARQYFFNKGEKNRTKFISRMGEYHGVTFGALSINGLTSIRTAFEPLLPGFHFVPAPYCYRCAYGMTYPSCDLLCAKMVETTMQFLDPSTVAGFVGEPIITGGGIMVPPKEYWPMVREICTKYGVLLIDDEVICGFGRTGKWFGCQNWGGYKPDLMSTAKGIVSGYIPFAATMATKEIFDAFKGGPEKEFWSGNTFGGHPVGAAASLANIEIMQNENLPANGAEVGAYLLEGLKTLYKHPTVGDVRGFGMLGGIEFVKDKKTKERFEQDVPSMVADECYDLGLYCRGIFGAVQLAPPLILTKAQADKIVDICDKAISRVEKKVL